MQQTIFKILRVLGVWVLHILTLGLDLVWQKWIWPRIRPWASSYAKNRRWVSIALDFQKLRILFWNVRNLGEDAWRKHADKIRLIAEIICGPSMTVLIEYRGKSEQTLDTILEQVNGLTSSGLWNWLWSFVRITVKNQYTYVAGVFVGETNRQERFVIFFNQLLWRFVEGFAYRGDLDFKYTPFIGVFETKRFLVSKQYVIICVHLNINSVHEELDRLTDLVAEIQEQFPRATIVVGGDYNASKAYFPLKQRPKNRFFTLSKFHWCIDCETDTSSGDKDDALDRIVVAIRDVKDKAIKHWVMLGSGYVIRVKDELHELTDGSDHLPIGIKVRNPSLLTYFLAVYLRSREKQHN